MIPKFELGAQKCGTDICGISGYHFITIISSSPNPAPFVL